MVEDNYMASHNQSENDPTNTLTDSVFWWENLIMMQKYKLKTVHKKAVAVKTPPYMNFH